MRIKTAKRKYNAKSSEELFGISTKPNSEECHKLLSETKSWGDGWKSLALKLIGERSDVSDLVSEKHKGEVTRGDYTITYNNERHITAVHKNK